VAGSLNLTLSGVRLRILIWICVLISVNQLGFGSIVPVVPLYASDFGVSKSAIGATIAIYGLARFLFNVPAGQIADQFGRRSTFAIGGATTVVGNALCALAPDYSIFLAARFVAGAGAAMVLTGGQIVLADIASPENRGRVMAVYQGVFLVSVGAGAFPGGLLAEHYGLAAPFVANASLAAIVTILAWWVVPETRNLRHIAGAVAMALPPLGQQLRLITATPGFLLISLVSFTSFFARTGALFTVIPILAQERMGLAAGQIGFGLGMISLLGLLLAYPSGVLVDRFGRKTVIVPSTLLTAAAMLLFSGANGFTWFVVSCIVWSAASGISGAAPAAYAADMAPAGMNAAALSGYRMLADLGYVVGPLSLGIVADLASPTAALWVTALFLTISGLSFARFAPETHPPRATNLRDEVVLPPP